MIISVESRREPSVTRAADVYVKAIYGLRERGVAVTTSALAAGLGVTPSSVSSMLARLSAMGLIEHRPYADSRLTDAGLAAAMRLTRRRRLIELFLIESLGYGWEEVEQEADKLEQVASDVFVERISTKLEHPTLDPHGDPIPTRDGQIVSRPSQVLARLESGFVGRLVRVWNGNPEVLRYLDSCGIELGERIELLHREPFGGSLIIQVGDPADHRVHGVGLELAEVLSLELES
jgi:DtxR family transcriptional regulator, Mn-dependent transcriptional regulator